MKKNPLWIVKLPLWMRLIVWKHWHHIHVGDDDTLAIQKAIDIANLFSIRVKVTRFPESPAQVEFPPGTFFYS